MNETSRTKLANFPVSEPLLDSNGGSERIAPHGDADASPWHLRESFASLPETSSERSSRIVDPRPRPESAPSKPVKIAIKSKGKILLLSPADILAVEAEGNYVLLIRHSESHLLRESISTMAEKLKPYQFVRIHRSVLVNASTVEEIYPGETGEYMLRMAGGKQYVVSRTYKQNLKLLAQSWIGIDSFVDD